MIRKPSQYSQRIAFDTRTSTVVELSLINLSINGFFYQNQNKILHTSEWRKIIKDQYHNNPFFFLESTNCYSITKQIYCILVQQMLTSTATKSKTNTSTQTQTQPQINNV
jgi:hypothetical protein